MKPLAIDYAMYGVSDLAKSIEFYEKIVGLKLSSQGEGWAELLAGTDALVLGTWGYDAKKAGNGNGVAFAVADIKKAVADLKKKGVKIIDDKIWETPVCHGATFLDPDGNKVSLHHRMDGTVG